MCRYRRRGKLLEEAESPQAMADGRPVTERLYVENVAHPSRLFPRLLRLSRSLPDPFDSSRRLALHPRLR